MWSSDCRGRQPKAQGNARPDGLMKAIVERNTGRISAMLLSSRHTRTHDVSWRWILRTPASTLRDMVFTHPTIA